MVNNTRLTGVKAKEFLQESHFSNKRVSEAGVTSVLCGMACSQIARHPLFEFCCTSATLQKMVGRVRRLI